MKPSDKAALFTVPASALIVVGVFARSLGFSEPAGLIIFLCALMLLLLGYRELIKAKDSSQPTVPTEPHPLRRFWVLTGTYGVVCLALPFLLPYTGLNLPLAQRVVVSAITFIICLAATWFDSRKGLGMTKHH